MVKIGYKKIKNWPLQYLYCMLSPFFFHNCSIGVYYTVEDVHWNDQVLHVCNA